MVYLVVMTIVAIEMVVEIARFPIKHDGSFCSYVSLPEGIFCISLLRYLPNPIVIGVEGTNVAQSISIMNPTAS